jgi:EmrB/QacA subfamily drug resistance transporter
VFPPHERPKAIAIWASFTGAAGAIGPVASGLLLSRFWYGSVFLVNVPIILLALVSGRFLVPRSRDPQEARLDPVGAVLSVIGIGALVYGLIQAPTNGWTSVSTLGAFAVAILVLTAFAFWELRVDEPMLDIRYFKNPAFSTGTGGMILAFLGMYGVMFLITQYFQLVLGLTALAASLRTLPVTPIMLIVAPLTPRLVARFRAHRLVAFGMLCVAAGLLMFIGLTPHTPYIYVFFCLVPFISGIALTMSPMTASIMSAVPPRRAGAGSAMNDATRELGAALGVAVMGSVAASEYGGRLARLISGIPASSRQQARSSLAGALQVAHGLPRATGPALAQAAKVAFVDGIHLACVLSAGLAVVACVVVLRYLPPGVAEGRSAHEPAEPVEADGVAVGLAVDGTSPALAN